MSETLLLDANVLIALCIRDHVHHELATRWFKDNAGDFATCPITQGALVRFTLRHLDQGAQPARQLLEAIVQMQGHEFWPDDLEYSDLPWRQIFGHRQVTDAYLVALAERHGGRLATLDQALATVFPQTLLVHDSV
jgi:toxin-antitoxin system PIN domain toxin